MEGIQQWTWPIDPWNGVITYKGGNTRLLNESFESKPIKRGGKTPNQHLKSTPMMRTHIQMAY